MSASNDQRQVSFRRITAAELDAATYEQNYLIEDLLVEGQPCIMAGGKKTLKTNILIDLALSLATGTPFLGKFAVKRSVRVLMMSGESGEATIQETARRICRMKSRNRAEGDRRIELADASNFNFSPDLPRLDDAHHQVALEQLLIGDKIEVLILDPAYLCLPGDDAGNLFKQGAMLRTISDLCSRNGVTLILCHHTKKGGGSGAERASQFQPPELADIAWAGFQEFARQWILVGRRKAYEPGTGHHELWLNAGGSAGHSSLWALDIDEGNPSDFEGRRWQVKIGTAGEARQEAAGQRQAAEDDKHEAKTAAASQAIVNALLDAPGHADTRDKIKARAGTKGKAFEAAWGKLTLEGKIKPCKVKRQNNQEYNGFQLLWSCDDTHTSTAAPIT